MPQLVISVDGVESHRVYLNRDRTTLGRMPHNHIVLTDLAVSGQHCVFELKGLSDVFVEDLGSTNGTYVNRKMVRRQELHDGDVIAIGKFKLAYHTANELTDQATTAAMPLDMGAFLASTGALHACLKVLSGTSAGLELPVVKAVATFGKRGVATIAIAHRRNGYFVSCVEAAVPPTLNGKPIDEDPVMLADYDVIELAGTTLEFSLKA